ncbi:cytochrome oxidase Cu insertion factor (SCO1/SenC/PrrC family) [Prosthecobacter fusiformis]|uniref:Cytochrome oxidase Cu insertion factor (SCO1/SenC/PrrC family) n=1 Tax=Prosthecobacter fusiformis TaxID=48464 RepID=A0A4R7SQU6_9BACT|nr:SCO family protein [Prosthecobacter fusiformis]TDU80989.1 cytochrome oxidase Cu insertion factor (SCO1/SenC/PrrC family) [Prosthecobacter fusiformis]
MSDQHTDPKPNLTPWAIWIPIIIAVLGVVVFYNYLLAMQQQAASEEKDRPAILGRLERDLELTERTGKKVHLDDLRGKIILASWVYTRCPRGCAGVIAKLKKLQEEYRGNPDIHFVSFTLDPEDTPEMMKLFASGIDVKDTDPWWFVQGDKEEVRRYMTQYLKFRPVQDLPEKDRLSPADKYIHDLRVALVDHKGHLRGTLYDLMNADPQFAEHFDAQLRKDLDFILKEKQKEVKEAL